MAHQRHPLSPNSCSPSSPSPSMTNGNAVPSLSPPSPVRPKRSRSRSVMSAICTSDASTGSVGAKIPPSNTAAPSGKFSSHMPATVIKPTVITIDTVASCTGMRQRLSFFFSSNFMPTVNSEISSATSASRSSNSVFLKTSSLSKCQPNGPMATPAAKYSMAALIGSRAIKEPPRVLAISSTPNTMQPNVKASLAFIHQG